MILLDVAAPGGISVSTVTYAVNFEDVFKDENALEKYMLCFA